MLVERQANGDNVRDYTYHPQGYGALLSESQVYHHYDGLGSTDRTTDASGVVESHFLYHAFGEEEEVLTTAAGETRYRWLGEIGYYWQPSTSHYWVRASVYNDTNGRWLKRDPLQQTNPYRYVGNNPLSMVDPSGLQPYGPHGNPMLCSQALNYERCMQHHRAMRGGGGGGLGGRYQEPWWERARDWYMGGMGGASDWLDLFGGMRWFGRMAGRYDSGLVSYWEALGAGIGEFGLLAGEALVLTEFVPRFGAWLGRLPWRRILILGGIPFLIFEEYILPWLAARNRWRIAPPPRPARPNPIYNPPEPLRPIPVGGEGGEGGGY